MEPPSSRQDKQSCAMNPICLNKKHCREACHPDEEQARGFSPTPSLAERVLNLFINGSLCFVKAIAVCFYTCYVFCPPVPSICARKIAFHPPTNQRYKFIIKSDSNKEVSAPLKKCFGRPILRMVLELEVRDSHRIQHCRSRPVEDVYPFVTKSSRNNYIAGVFVPCRLWNRPTLLDKTVVIFCQPNSSNLSTFLWGIHGFSFREMSDRIGVDVYAFDYSGFGLSTGTPSEANLYADVKAVYEYVKENRPDCKIYLVGASLGTAASVDLASKNPEKLGGVVLLAPFVSGMSVMCGVRDKSFKVDAFRSIDKAPIIEVPVLIIHGLKDEIISYEHSIVLARTLQKPVPVELLRNADHMSVLDTHSTPVYKRIINFLLSDAPEYDSIHNRDTVMTVLDKRLEKLNRIRDETERQQLGAQTSNTKQAHDIQPSHSIQLQQSKQAPIPLPFYVMDSPLTTIADKFVDIKPEELLPAFPDNTMSEDLLDVTQKSNSE